MLNRQEFNKIIKKIIGKSYLANDVWNCTEGERIYQYEEVPVIEVEKVFAILKDFYITKEKGL